MTTAQIIIYAILVLLIILYLRKFLIARSVQQCSPSDVAAKIEASTQVVLLDVRTERERRRQHIKGSLHIPLQALVQRVDELEPYRKHQIICYCQTGSRSVDAALQLTGRGYNASSMNGGISEWNFSRLER